MKHTNKVSQIVREVKEYERRQAEKELCMTSWVQPMQNSIVLNGVGHSGSAVHVCVRPKHDAHELCVCACRASQVTAK